MANKRSAERQSAWWPIRIKHGRGVVEGRTLDVSNTGILFLSPIRYKPGVKLEIDIATSPMAFFRCTVYVVREKLRLKGQWAYGARFVNMTPMDRDIMVKSLALLGRNRVLSGASTPQLNTPLGE